MTIFEPIEKRPTKKFEVGERLRDAILEGRIKPGEKIIESRIAKCFGISRAPLREALSALAEEGLIVNEPFSGYYVTVISKKSISELYEMRRVLEIFAYELIWSKRSVFFLQQLTLRHQVLKKCILQGEKSAAIKAELSLHATVFEQCGNTLLLTTWRGLAGQLQLYWSLQQETHGRTGARLDAHEDYILLACGNDLELMKKEIVEHVKRGLEKTVMALAENGEISC